MQGITPIGSVSGALKETPPDANQDKQASSSSMGRRFCLAMKWMEDALNNAKAKFDGLDDQFKCKLKRLHNDVKTLFRGEKENSVAGSETSSSEASWGSRTVVFLKNVPKDIQKRVKDLFSDVKMFVSKRQQPASVEVQTDIVDCETKKIVTPAQLEEALRSSPIILRTKQIVDKAKAQVNAMLVDKWVAEARAEQAETEKYVALAEKQKAEEKAKEAQQLLAKEKDEAIEQLRVAQEKIAQMQKAAMARRPPSTSESETSDDDGFASDNGRTSGQEQRSSSKKTLVVVKETLEVGVQTERACKLNCVIACT